MIIFGNNFPQILVGLFPERKCFLERNTSETIHATAAGLESALTLISFSLCYPYWYFHWSKWLTWYRDPPSLRILNSQ